MVNCTDNLTVEGHSVRTAAVGLEEYLEKID